MTREEAIIRIEDYAAYLHGKPEPTYQIEVALDMAISALREQEERSKGCEFCCYMEYPEKKLHPKERDGFDFYAGAWKRIADDDFVEDETDCIKFCPMCGRRLEEV